MDQLTRLPHNVRTRIYEELLLSSDPINPSRPTRFSVAILCVNKAIYRETWTILYRQNCFDFGSYNADTLKRFLQKIGRRNANTIQHVFIKFPSSLFSGPGGSALDDQSERLFRVIRNHCTSVRDVTTRLLSDNFVDLRLDIPDHARCVAETSKLASACFEAVPSSDKVIVKVCKAVTKHGSSRVEFLPKCRIEACPNGSHHSITVHFQFAAHPNVALVFHKFSAVTDDELRGVNVSLQFDVRSEALLKSSVFRSMLMNNTTAESVHFLQHGHVDIMLPEDEPAYMLTLLQILNGSISTVPLEWDAASLSGIVSVADKYDVKDLLTKPVKRWIHQHKSLSVEKIGKDFLDWVWIAWSFEVAEIFKSATEAATIYSSDRITAQDSDLPLPDHLIDAIQGKRLEAIGRIHAQLIAERLEYAPLDSTRQRLPSDEYQQLSNGRLHFFRSEDHWLLHAFKSGVIEHVLHRLNLRSSSEDDSKYDGISLHEMWEAIKDMRAADEYSVMSTPLAMRLPWPVAAMSGSLPVIGQSIQVPSHQMYGPPVIKPLLDIIECLQREGLGLCLEQVKEKRGKPDPRT